MILIVVGVLLGSFIGFQVRYTYNPAYSLYVSIGILACLDSIIGGIRANMEGKFNNIIFVSGFVLNALLAALLAFVGDKLGIPLHYAAIVTFGGRLFDNVSQIRRIIIEKIKNKNSKKEK